jgi:spectinomycin phosphotransferase
MLEKPDFPDEKIVACLAQEFGLLRAQIEFLPLGADLNTAVYRATIPDGVAYFVKLRRGALADILVTLPRYFHDHGLQHIIPPIPTHRGELWASLEPFKLILYPYIDGRDGYEASLSDQHWRALGDALRRIHTLPIPLALLDRIPQETYSPFYRERLTAFLEAIETAVYTDPVAIELAGILQARRDEVIDLLRRTERLAQQLQAQPAEFVVCHADLHAGNVLIEANGGLYIVDWDTLIRAPKERDLMYAGGGQFANRRTPEAEEALFYQGYGPTPVDQAALAFYRYERIVEDLAIYCEQLLMRDAGGEDRAQSLQYFLSNFQPGGVIEIADRMDMS